MPVPRTSRWPGAGGQSAEPSRVAPGRLGTPLGTPSPAHCGWEALMRTVRTRHTAIRPAVKARRAGRQGRQRRVRRGNRAVRPSAALRAALRRRGGALHGPTPEVPASLPAGLPDCMALRDPERRSPALGIGPPGSDGRSRWHRPAAQARSRCGQHYSPASGVTDATAGAPTARGGGPARCSPPNAAHLYPQRRRDDQAGAAGRVRPRRCASGGVTRRRRTGAGACVRRRPSGGARRRPGNGRPCPPAWRRTRPGCRRG